MDQTPPSTTPPEGSPPHTPDTARVILPEEPTEDTSAPPDPYASYKDLDYATMLDDTPVYGIEPDELRTVYGPARTAAYRLGLDGFEDDYDLASRGEVLRGLAAYQRDHDIQQAAYDRLHAQLPPGAKLIQAAPLAGDALETAIRSLAQQYFPKDAADVLRSARAQLIQAAQERHQLTSTLQALERIRPQLDARQEAAREAAAQARTGRDVAQMTRQDIEVSYAEAWARFRQAEERRDEIGKRSAKLEMERLGRFL